MNIKEIVKSAKEHAPKRLGNMPDIRAAALLHEAFSVILWQLEETAEGPVKVAGLGTFRIRQVEIEKDGQKQVVKRVIFKPMQPNT